VDTEEKMEAEPCDEENKSDVSPRKENSNPESWGVSMSPEQQEEEKSENPKLDGENIFEEEKE